MPVEGKSFRHVAVAVQRRCVRFPDSSCGGGQLVVEEADLFGDTLSPSVATRRRSQLVLTRCLAPIQMEPAKQTKFPSKVRAGELVGPHAAPTETFAARLRKAKHGKAFSGPRVINARTPATTVVVHPSSETDSVKGGGLRRRKTARLSPSPPPSTADCRLPTADCERASSTSLARASKPTTEGLGGTVCHRRVSSSVTGA
jgi:hypothetical protein